MPDIFLCSLIIHMKNVKMLTRLLTDNNITTELKSIKEDLQMRKFGLSVMMLVVVLISSAVLVSAYSPSPGVLDPQDVDFGGKTVSILIRDIDWVVFNGGKPTEERVAEAEELYNVKIEVGTFSGSDAIMSRIMANDSTYDIIRTNHRSGYFPLVSSGMLSPISQIMPPEYFESLPTPDQYTIEKLAFRGDLYGFGVTYGLFNGSMMIFRYNKDLIEEAGLEDPYELWLEDRWDWEKFEEMCIALTKDTDGDGVIDQFGYYDVGNSTAAYRFLPFNGAEVAKRDENGKWVYALNEPEAINALNIIVRWRNLGILGSGGYEKVAFAGSHVAGMRHDLAAGANFGYIPYPKGPDVETNQWPVFDFSSNFLPVNVAYPEGMIALADFLFREEDGEEYLDFYINTYMKTREQLDAYMAGVDQWYGEGDVFQWSGLWDTTDAAVNAVLNGEKGAAAALDEVAPQAQAFLDDLFDQ